MARQSTNGSDVGWRGAHIQDGAPRSWERVTGGREAAWVGPLVAGSWGRLSRHPPRPAYKAFPGREQWPPRTASSFGKGAPSCRGGEPRTLRGRGYWIKPFQILSPKSRVPGAPLTLGGWCEKPWLGELGLRGGCRAAVRLRSRHRALGMDGCGSRSGSRGLGVSGSGGAALSWEVARVWA